MRETNQLFTGEEYQARLGIWLTNKRLIQEHNAANKGFFLEANKFAHLTPSEYKSMLGFRMNLAPQGKTLETAAPNVDSIDWRQKGVVNAVKDQASCGSCWAFSTIQAMESHWAINHNKLFSLSEQNLVDCVTSCYGCNGGLMTSAYSYVVSKQSGKFQLETDYPYTGKEGSCNFQSGRAPAPVVTGYVEIKKGSESDLAAKVALGPVCIAIDASHSSFQLYSSGIYDESSCSSTSLDHGVGCVGFGSTGGVSYWIVRNSWGTSWGENGYVRMVKDKSNQCGEATMACYPTVA
jgi:cathepsin L